MEQYRAIGGRSPYNELTFRQAECLAALLREKGTPLKIYVGMRNWPPTLRETLYKMRREGVRRAVGLVLAPHRSQASWERYLEAVEEARKELGAESISIDYCGPWHDHPLFIEAIAQSIRETLGDRPVLESSNAWIFTAHSIPVEMDQESGYSKQVMATSARVAEKLGPAAWHLAYQSRSGRPEQPWLEPDVGDKIRELASKGTKTVLAVPVGFLCDHVEVLYDLDVKAAKAAEDAGVNFLRAKTVNDHPLFIAMLADLVLKQAHSS